MGQYGKAKEAYESYLKVGTPTEQDYTRYATLLYLNKDYAQSSDTVSYTHLVERSIRPLTLNRKNTLFSGSHEAAHALSLIHI